MSTKPVGRALLVVLALTLFVLPVVAEARGLQASRDEARTVAARVQEGDGIFQMLWKRVIGVWGKNGAWIDPTGSSGGSTTNSGASIDPDGSSGGGTNSGPSIDPTGAPTPPPPSGNGG